MSVILADLGASNARLAVLKNNRVSDVYQFACDDFENAYKLLTFFKAVYAPKANALVIGAAGVLVNNQVSWTNRKWKISVRDLQKKLHLSKVILKNDVQAQCMGLTQLNPKDLKILQKGQILAGVKALLSLGTGLGMGYVAGGEAFASELGQTLTVQGKLLEKTLARLPANARRKAVTHSPESCDKFYQNLAQICMNLALTLKPTEGLYLYGKMLDEKWFVKAKFISQFKAHPTMEGFLKTVPVFLIKKENLAFVGLKELAKKYGLS